ncbi:PEP-CTERM sorting domain-containing protein [Nostoc sp.]|uniref:PEP-CTERM sorting domain-containing protein n=1 Tax=Nostoc sp. TaxID=1180 RepID=UPI002FFC022C
MTKNNRKKAVAQAISTAVALGWVMIMQVESAQAATLTVNNLNDGGVGSLRDTINMATSNDVVEFLLGSHPSTIALTSGALAMPAAGYAYAKNLTINGPGANLLTITGNNQFPVFNISAANVTLSGLAIAGDFNAYNFSNLTFTNSTVTSDNVKIDNATGNLRLINSTISSKDNIAINANRVYLDDHSNLIGGDITITANSLEIVGSSQLATHNTVNGNSGQISSDGNNSEAGGNIIVTATDNISLINPGSQVTGNSGHSSGGNNSQAAGDITITTSSIILRPGAFISKPVPEPSAIAGGSNNSGAGGNITINAPNGFIIAVPNEPSAIATGSNNSGAGGNIIVTASEVISLTTVPEPSAIAGSILAGSLAWLAKRKQAAFRKAKV